MGDTWLSERVRGRLSLGCESQGQLSGRGEKRPFLPGAGSVPGPALQRARCLQHYCVSESWLLHIPGHSGAGGRGQAVCEACGSAARVRRPSFPAAQVPRAATASVAGPSGQPRCVCAGMWVSSMLPAVACGLGSAVSGVSC